MTCGAWLESTLETVSSGDVLFITENADRPLGGAAIATGDEDVPVNAIGITQVAPSWLQKLAGTSMVSGTEG